MCHEAIICRSFKEVSIEKYWQREKGEAIRPRPPSLPRGLSNFVSLCQDPEPFPYLKHDDKFRFDVQLEVSIKSMR